MASKPSLYAPLTQVTKDLVKATYGHVSSLFASNANASLRYLQLHNKASPPAGGDVPVYSIPIPAGAAAAPGMIILDQVFFSALQREDAQGGHFPLGIGVAISTTFGNFTDSATAADHVVVIHYD